MILKLALRNVASNRDRSLLVVLSLALSSLVLVVGASLVSSLSTNIENGLKRGFAGDLQVFHAANPPLHFTEEVPVDFLPVPDPDAVRRLLLADPEVDSVAPRASASGLLLAGPRTAPAVLVGIDAETEAATLSRLRPGDGRAFARSGWILLGRPIAERLRAAEGDEVALLIPTVDGLFEGDLLESAGIYESPGLPLLDQFIAFVRLDELQGLIGNEGLPGSLVIHLRAGTDLGSARDRLQRALDDAGLALTVRSWRELAGDLLGMVQIGGVMLGSGFAFLLLVVALGVGNMLLILMLERTREIGLMRALGTTRTRVIGTVLAEVTFLSAASSAIGTLAGGLLCAFLGRVGIPAASRAMSYAFGGPRFFPEIHAADLLVGFLVVALVGPVAALGSALRVSATDPADTMRSPV